MELILFCVGVVVGLLIFWAGRRLLANAELDHWVGYLNITTDEVDGRQYAFMEIVDIAGLRDGQTVELTVKTSRYPQK